MDSYGKTSFDEMFGHVRDVLCTNDNYGMSYKNNFTTLLVLWYQGAGIMGKHHQSFSRYSSLNILKDCGKSESGEYSTDVAVAGWVNY